MENQQQFEKKVEEMALKSAALDIILDAWEDERRPKGDIGRVVQRAYDIFRGDSEEGEME